MSSDDTVIQVRDLSKRYEIYDKPRDRLKQYVAPRLRRALGLAPRQYFREFWALRDVSFSVRRGETVGIVGRNGSGKSTLLQTICGTLRTTAGDLQTHGRIAALLELGSGFNPEFSGRENVIMNARLLGLSEQQIAERFDAIVAFAEIGDFLEQPVKTYSSGMYVRLAFAVIAHVDADILVIDEALAVGDAYFSQKCMRFLRSFKERGTLLFVSHDPSAVVQLCDRAVWLDRGRLAMDASAKLVMESYLAELYGGAATPAAAPAATPATATVVAPPPTATRTFAMKPGPQEPGERRFGTGQAAVTEVRLCLAASGETLQWVEGGETVRLEVVLHAATPLRAPIVGFIVKDRLGQHLFGDNTYLTHAAQPVPCPAGGSARASFTFTMPILPKGEYSVAVAVADGTQEEHVVHEWLHEALLFQSHSASVVSGLVGIPMLGVGLSLAPTSSTAPHP